MPKFDVGPIRDLGNQWINTGERLLEYLATMHGAVGAMGAGWTGKAGRAAQLVWDGHGEAEAPFNVWNSLWQAATVAVEIGRAILSYADELQKAIKEIERNHLIEALATIFGTALGIASFGVAGILGEMATAVGEIVASVVAGISRIASAAGALGRVAAFSADAAINAAMTLGTDVVSQIMASAAAHGPLDIDWKGEGLNIGLGVWAGAGMGGVEAHLTNPHISSGAGLPHVSDVNTPTPTTVHTDLPNVGGTVHVDLPNVTHLAPFPTNSVIETNNALPLHAGATDPVTGSPRTGIGSAGANVPLPGDVRTLHGGPEGAPGGTARPGTGPGLTPPATPGREVAHGAGTPPHLVRDDAPPVASTPHANLDAPPRSTVDAPGNAAVKPSAPRDNPPGGRDATTGDGVRDVLAPGLAGGGGVRDVLAPGGAAPHSGGGVRENVPGEGAPLQGGPRDVLAPGPAGGGGGVRDVVPPGGAASHSGGGVRENVPGEGAPTQGGPRDVLAPGPAGGGGGVRDVVPPGGAAPHSGGGVPHPAGGGRTTAAADHGPEATYEAGSDAGRGSAGPAGAGTRSNVEQLPADARTLVHDAGTGGPARQGGPDVSGGGRTATPVTTRGPHDLAPGAGGNRGTGDPSYVAPAEKPPGGTARRDDTGAQDDHRPRPADPVPHSATSAHSEPVDGVALAANSLASHASAVPVVRQHDAGSGPGVRPGEAAPADAGRQGHGADAVEGTTVHGPGSGHEGPSGPGGTPAHDAGAAGTGGPHARDDLAGGGSGTPGHGQPTPEEAARHSEWNTFKHEQTERHLPVVDAEGRLETRAGELDEAWQQGYDTFTAIGDGSQLPADGLAVRNARHNWRQDITREFRAEVDRSGHVTTDAFHRIVADAKANAYKYLVRADQAERLAGHFKEQIAAYKANRFGYGEDLPQFDGLSSRYVFDSRLNTYVKSDGKLYGYPEDADHNGPVARLKDGADGSSPDDFTFVSPSDSESPVDYFRDRSHDFNPVEHLFIGKAEDLNTVLDGFMRDPGATGMPDEATQSHIDAVKDSVFGGIRDIGEREHDIRVTGGKVADDILRVNSEGPGAAGESVLNRVRQEFLRDLRTDHELVFRNGRTPGAEELWQMAATRAVDQVPGRIARERYVESRLPEETAHADDVLSGLGADALDRLGEGGRQRVLGEYLNNVRDAAGHHFDLVSDTTGKPGSSPAGPWADLRDRVRSTLDDTIRHEADLQDVVADAARSFHHVVGHPDSIESSQLHDDTLGRLGSDFRTERVTRYDELFAPEGHRTDTWLAHESRNGDSFTANLDDLRNNWFHEGDFGGRGNDPGASGAVVHGDKGSAVRDAFGRRNDGGARTPAPEPDDAGPPLPVRDGEGATQDAGSTAVPRDTVGEQEHPTVTPSRDTAGHQEQLTVTPSRDTVGEQEQLTVTPSRDTVGEQEQLTVTPSRDTAGHQEQLTVTPSRETAAHQEQLTVTRAPQEHRGSTSLGGRQETPTLAQEVNQRLRGHDRATPQEVEDALHEVLAQTPQLPQGMRAVAVAAHLNRSAGELASAANRLLVDHANVYVGGPEIQSAHRELGEAFGDDFRQLSLETRAGAVAARVMDNRALLSAVNTRVQSAGYASDEHVAHVRQQLTQEFGNGFQHVDLDLRADVVADRVAWQLEMAHRVNSWLRPTGLSFTYQDVSQAHAYLTQRYGSPFTSLRQAEQAEAVATKIVRSRPALLEAHREFVDGSSAEHLFADRNRGTGTKGKGRELSPLHEEPDSGAAFHEEAEDVPREQAFHEAVDEAIRDEPVLHGLTREEVAEAFHIHQRADPPAQAIGHDPRAVAQRQRRVNDLGHIARALREGGAAAAEQAARDLVTAGGRSGAFAGMRGRAADLSVPSDVQANATTGTSDTSQAAPLAGHEEPEALLVSDPRTFLQGNVLSMDMEGGLELHASGLDALGRDRFMRALDVMPGLPEHRFVLVRRGADTTGKPVYVLAPAAEWYVRRYGAERFGIGQGTRLPEVRAESGYVNAAFVPYLTRGSADYARRVGHAEVPRHPGVSEPRLVVTPTMNGCAYAVTPHTDPARVTVWHYQSPDSNMPHPVGFRREQRPVDWFGAGEYAGAVPQGSLFEVANLMWYGRDGWEFVSQENRTGSEEKTVTLAAVRGRPAVMTRGGELGHVVRAYQNLARSELRDWDLPQFMRRIGEVSPAGRDAAGLRGVFDRIERHIGGEIDQLGRVADLDGLRSLADTFRAGRAALGSSLEALIAQAGADASHSAGTTAARDAVAARRGLAEEMVDQFVNRPAKDWIDQLRAESAPQHPRTMAAVYAVKAREELGRNGSSVNVAIRRIRDAKPTGRTQEYLHGIVERVREEITDEIGQLGRVTDLAGLGRLPDTFQGRRDHLSFWETARFGVAIQGWPSKDRLQAEKFMQPVRDLLDALAKPRMEDWLGGLRQEAAALEDGSAWQRLPRTDQQQVGRLVGERLPAGSRDGFFDLRVQQAYDALDETARALPLPDRARMLADTLGDGVRLDEVDDFFVRSVNTRLTSLSRDHVSPERVRETYQELADSRAVTFTRGSSVSRQDAIAQHLAGQRRTADIGGAHQPGESSTATRTRRRRPFPASVPEASTSLPPLELSARIERAVARTPRLATIGQDISERRPARLDRDLPPASLTAVPVRFSDEAQLPLYMAGGVGSRIPGLPQDVARRSFSFGQSEPALHGADQVVRELGSRLGQSASTRPVPSRGDGPGLLEQVTRALSDDPQGFFGDGRTFVYQAADGKSRTLEATARPYGRWQRFTFGYGKPVKIDTMQRSAVTSGQVKVNGDSFSLGSTVPLGPVSNAVTPFGRLSVQASFGKQARYSLQNQVMNQTETRTSDDSHEHLDDVWYEFSVKDRAGHPVDSTGSRVAEGAAARRPVAFGFAVRDGLAVRLADSVTSSKPLQEALPQRMTLGRNAHFRMVNTEAYGPVSHIREWVLRQAAVPADSMAASQIGDFFSTEGFHRMSRTLNTGRVFTPQLAGGPSGTDPLGVFTVTVESGDAVLINETKAAELRDTAQATVRTERTMSSSTSAEVGATAGPGFHLFGLADGAFDLRLLAGLSARYGATRTRGTVFGGSGAVKAAAQAKGALTGLYLVQKTVTVTAPPAAGGALTGPRTETFQTWAVERLTGTEARRLAGEPGVDTPPAQEPAAPPYLSADEPPTLGMSRVEEFTFADGNITRVVGGRPVTFPEHFADEVLRQIDRVYPNTVAPLDQLDPKNSRWRGTGHFETVLSNTLEVLNSLSYQSMASSLGTMMTTGMRIGLTESTGLSRGHRYVWVDARLTGRRYEGTQEDLRLRYSAPGSENLTGQQGGATAVQVGVEGLVSVRDAARDDIGRPVQAGTVSLGGRVGRRTATESGYGSVATHEALSIGNGGSHLYSYTVSLEARRGGFWRFRRWMRGLPFLPLLGTQPFVFPEQESTLLAHPDPATQRNAAGLGRVVLSIPVEHTPAGTVATPAQPARTEAMTDRDARHLALGTGESLADAAGRAPSPLAEHPHLTVSVRSDRQLTGAVKATLDEASGSSWLLTQTGAPAHDAAMRIFDPGHLTANFDQTSAATGWRAPGLWSTAPYLNRSAVLVHRTGIPAGMTALTKAVKVDTETTVGGVTPSAGRNTRTYTLFFGGQLGYQRSHPVGQGVTGTYALVASPYRRDVTRSRTVLRTAVAEINRKDTGRQVLVTAPVRHEVAVASERAGAWAHGWSHAPRWMAAASGRTVLLPDGWVGHVPEKSAHRLGLLADSFGEVPLYDGRTWSPLPWLREQPFGSWPVNSLNTADALREFEERLRPLGLSQEDREQLHRLVSDRVVRAIAKEMASTGASVPARVGRWGSQSAQLWLGHRQVKLRAELVPVRDSGANFRGLGHSVELEEHRQAAETVQDSGTRATGAALGFQTSEGAHTHDPVARSAGPTYTQAGSSVQSTAQTRSEGSVRISTATTTQAHGEYATEYELRLALEITDTRPADPVPAGPRTVVDRLTGQAGLWTRKWTGRRQHSIDVRRNAGRLIEHYPLSLMRPGPSDQQGRLDLPATQLLTRSTAPRRVPVPRSVGAGGRYDVASWAARGGVEPFELPAEGFTVRSVVGLDRLHTANTVALGTAYGSSLSAREGDAADEDLLAEVRNTPLTRSGTGAAQSLEDGTSNSALAAFYEQTLTPDGYQVVGLTERGFFGAADGTLALHSRPDLAGAQLLAVADGMKFEAPRRDARGSSSSASRVGASENSLHGGPTTSTVTGTNQFGSASAGHETDFVISGSAAEQLGSVNVKPNAGRSFLFAIPTTWLSVAHVHRHKGADTAVAFFRSPFGDPRRGPQAWETETTVLAWVREDVARRLDLIDDANFPADVAESWDAVTKADKEWTGADKKYWDLRRGDGAKREAALAAAESDLTALTTAPGPDLRAAQEALTALEQEAGSAEADHGGWEEVQAERIEAARTRLAQARRFQDRLDAARAVRDGAQARLAEFRTELRAHQDYAEALADELARVREGADRLTAWYQHQAVPAGSRLTPRPDRVTFAPPKAPKAESTKPEVKKQGSTKPEVKKQGSTKPEVKKQESTTPEVKKTGAALRTVGQQGPDVSPAFARPPWQYEGGPDQDLRHFDAAADHRTLTATDPDGREWVLDLHRPDVDGNGFYAAVQHAGDGRAGDPAGLAARVAHSPDLPAGVLLDPRAVFHTRELDTRLGQGFRDDAALHDRITADGGRLPEALRTRLTAEQRRSLVRLNLRTSRRWDAETERLAAGLTARALRVDLTVVDEDGSYRYYTGADAETAGPLPQAVVYRRGDAYLAARPRQGAVLPPPPTPLTRTGALPKPPALSGRARFLTGGQRDLPPVEEEAVVPGGAELRAGEGRVAGAGTRTGTVTAEEASPSEVLPADLLDPARFREHSTDPGASDLRSLSRVADLDRLLGDYQRIAEHDHVRRADALDRLADRARAYVTTTRNEFRRRAVRDLAEQAGSRADVYRGVAGTRETPAATLGSVPEAVPELVADSAPAGRLRYRERVGLAKRVWGEPVDDAVARLERLLLEAGPGARSLVMGAVPGEPLWAMNVGGTIRWLDHGTAGLTRAPRSPEQASQRDSTQDSTRDSARDSTQDSAPSKAVSIDLDPRARLINAPQRLLDAGDDASRFCELTLGADLKHVV
ncbi:hypothetical protein OG900_12040 [Streptomyces sp. NBC_00433]